MRRRRIRGGNRRGEQQHRATGRTGGQGADYTFEATGLVGVMGQAVEAARMGWGVCTVLGVAGKGEKLEIVPRFLITGRRVQGGSFGGAKRAKDDPRRLDWTVDAVLAIGALAAAERAVAAVTRALDQGA